MRTSMRQITGKKWTSIHKITWRWFLLERAALTDSHRDPFADSRWPKGAATNCNAAFTQQIDMKRIKNHGILHKSATKEQVQLTKETSGNSQCRTNHITRISMYAHCNESVCIHTL